MEARQKQKVIDSYKFDQSIRSIAETLGIGRCVVAFLARAANLEKRAARTSVHLPF